MEEDCYWFFDIVGKDWFDIVYFVMYNFKDESFISQFLLLKVMWDFKLFVVEDDDSKFYVSVLVIYDEQGYYVIREKLLVQYNFSNFEFNI